MIKRLMIVIAGVLAVVFMPYFVGMIPFLRVKELHYWVNGVATIISLVLFLAISTMIFDYIKNGN